MDKEKVIEDMAAAILRVQYGPWQKRNTKDLTEMALMQAKACFDIVERHLTTQSSERDTKCHCPEGEGCYFLHEENCTAD